MAQTQGQGTFLLSYFTTLTLLQLLSSPSPGSGKSDFKVSGHAEPIVALVGKDAELTCCLSPNISAKDMELRWYRDQPSQAVHVHVNGSDLPEEQMPLYQGRTTFLGVHLAQGKATVKIHNISPSDNGTFHCLFKDDTQINEATLWLQVAGLGSEPRILVQDDSHDHETQAKCTSEDWYPQPDVKWTDFQGQHLPSVTSVSSLETGLFAVESRVTVRDRHVEGLFCYISNPFHPPPKVAKYRLPGEALHNSRSSFAVWKIVLPLIAAVGMTAAGVICLFWKCQQKNRQQLEAEREHSEEEQRQQASPTEDPLAEGILDPDTASPILELLKDGRSMKRLWFKEEVPNYPGRFDKDPCVLGLQRFSTGRHYWEVQVGSRKAWILGVCQESVQRKGRIPKSPQHGIWALEWYMKTLRALTYPRVRIQLREPLSQVGILLDCDARSLTFLRPNGSLIYIFHRLTFTAPLRLFFCLWTQDPTLLSTRYLHPQLTLEPHQGQGEEKDRDPPSTPTFP